MFRQCLACLGRWKSWDHIKGRRKSGGAIHIRHTMGAKGHYKRLSKVAGSIREGRRHGANHMQGGLGVKLGGGLFGLRLPRQHALSTMTRDDFDLEVYGHPNITNPYREILDEHPDLEGVVRSAAIRATCLVALPPLSRKLRAMHVVQLPVASSESGETTSVSVPKRWLLALPHLVKLAVSLEELPGEHVACSEADRPPDVTMRLTESISLVLSTTESSVTLVFDRSEAAATEVETKEAIVRSLAVLYQDFAAGHKVGPSATAPAPTSSNKPPSLGRLLGSAMKLPKPLTVSPLFASPDAFTLPVELSICAKHRVNWEESKLMEQALGGDGSVVRMGVSQWLRQLQEWQPGALRVRCLLPLQSSRSTSSPFEASGREKHDSEAMDTLLRWHYYNNDPRSHFTDLASRSGRVMHLHTFVECLSLMKAPRNNFTDDGGEEEPAVEYRSIVGASTKKQLDQLGFRIAKEGPTSLFQVVKKWTSNRRLPAPVPTTEAQHAAEVSATPIVDHSSATCCTHH